MSNQAIQEVVIVYNPVSTGPGRKMSLKLEKQLKKTMPSLTVRVIPTEYALHAIELAEKHGGENVVLLAASGDGGYNELINGAMKVRARTKIMPICGVLPAGHANDHFRSLKGNESTLIANIQHNRTRQVDLLGAQYTNENGQRTERYAHSYIGLGLSPYIGKELNSTDVNNFNDKIIAAKSIAKFKPVKIKRRGRYKKIDSLIFSNTPKMARWLTLSDESSMDDGLFEVQMIGFRSPSHRIKQLIQMAQAKPPKSTRASSYAFDVCEDTLLQLDGEIVGLKGSTEVVITNLPGALCTIL